MGYSRARFSGPGWRSSSHSATAVRLPGCSHVESAKDEALAFRGTFDHTLDAKNRLTIPAKFRAALADGAVLARGSESCVEVWPAADYERLHGAALEGLNPLSPRARELRRSLFGGAFDTELDAAGRVMVPPKLIEHGSLGREVAVIGAGDCLEVWDRRAWSAHDEDSPARIHELTQDLGHPS